MDTGNYDRRGTPASSQIIWLEDRVKELEEENEKLYTEIDKLKERNTWLEKALKIIKKLGATQKIKDKAATFLREVNNE